MKFPVDAKRADNNLKRFPVIVEYDDRGRFLGLEVLRARPRRRLKHGRQRAK